MSLVGLKFEEAWEHKVKVTVEESIIANFISKEDLILNKTASGRDVDLLDIKNLSRK